MNNRDRTPGQALQGCLDALLGDIQARYLLRRVDDTWLLLVDQLASASQFLADKNSAEHCRALGQTLETSADESRDRMILKELLLCRESLQRFTSADFLRQLLADHCREAIDRLTVLPENPDAEQLWLRETFARCLTLDNAARFLVCSMTGRPGLPPQNARDLLRWLFALQASLAQENTGTGVPVEFRRELIRCAERCSESAAAPALISGAPEGARYAVSGAMSPEVSQELRKLHLLAGGLLAVESMTSQRGARQALRRHCQGLIASAAQALYCRTPARAAEHSATREVMRHALVLSGGQVLDSDDTVLVASLQLSCAALAALPAMVMTPVQALLATIFDNSGVTTDSASPDSKKPVAGKPGADYSCALVDWPAVSLQLYRLLVCLRLPGGGFVDLNISHEQQVELVRWQVLIACLHASVDHCLQQSVVTREDHACLLALLHRLTKMLRADRDAGPDATDLLPDTLMLAARLGLRAQRHWQQLTLELDAVQQDFAGVSVQHVLAAELRCLPGMDQASAGSAALPQDVLRDLRLLLKGARIMNVQRIESLVLVMIEVYEELLASPAFADSSGIGKLLPRAHRSLCRMLDQAAAWQAPGNARRMINSLYTCLERWRGDSGPDNAKVPDAVNERPAAGHNEVWRLCMASNRRMRKLLRHQDDLDDIRVLLLELLRSQEELIRRQADYGATLDVP